MTAQREASSVATLTLESSSACTAFAISPQAPSFLVTGSQDGFVRSYVLPESKVYKGIKLLGNEVSSICFGERSGDQVLPTCYIASGRTLFVFDFNQRGIILSPSNATKTIELLEDESDVLNQIALWDGKLAYSADSGKIAVYDLNNDSSKAMASAHASICNSVAFVPNWPSEIVSGGFDCRLLHFDVTEGELLSDFSFSASPTSGQMSLSPAFVLSIAFSDSGCLAASSADGRIWIGRKGAAGPDGRRVKKRTQWRGLLADDQGLNAELRVSEGPIVAIEFVKSTQPQKLLLLVLSLSGKLQLLHIKNSGTSRGKGHKDYAVIWEIATTRVSNANAMAMAAGQVLIAGVGAKGKGFVEIFPLPILL